jgi:hypothetical protein
VIVVEVLAWVRLMFTPTVTAVVDAMLWVIRARSRTCDPAVVGAVALDVGDAVELTMVLTVPRQTPVVSFHVPLHASMTVLELGLAATL